MVLQFNAISTSFTFAGRVGESNISPLPENDKCLKMSGGRDDNMRIAKIPPPKTVMSVSNADLKFVHGVLDKILTLFRDRGNQQGALQDEIVDAMGRIGEAP